MLAIALQSCHFSIGHDAAIALLDTHGQTLADLGIVHNTRFGHMNRFDTGGMGFDFLEVLPLDHGTAYPVGLTTFVDALQGRQLVCTGSHNDLATDLVLNPFGSA